MSTGAQADVEYGFGAIDDVLADPFPPGFDPATVRLPSVPKVRSDEDDEAHHREYWRAHVWAALHRYRDAFADPACPTTLRVEYPHVLETARRLVDRATGTYPIGPIDSVACHAALKELLAGAASLERTVAALRGAPDVPAAGARPDVLPATATPGGAVDDGAPDAPDAPVGADGARTDRVPPPAGVHGQDFFPAAPPPRGFELKLSLRGGRGLRRSRELAGGQADVDSSAG